MNTEPRCPTCDGLVMPCPICPLREERERKEKQDDVKRLRVQQIVSKLLDSVFKRGRK